MNHQRRLLCPPDEEPGEGEKNHFEMTRPYRHSQLTFKSFTEEEVRTQAGKEVLPPGDHEIKQQEEDDDEQQNHRSQSGEEEDLAPWVDDEEQAEEPEKRRVHRRRRTTPGNDGASLPPTGALRRRADTPRNPSRDRSRAPQDQDALTQNQGQSRDATPARRQSQNVGGSRGTLPAGRGASRADTPMISAKSAGKQRREPSATHQPISSLLPPTSAQPRKRYESETSTTEPEEPEEPEESRFARDLAGYTSSREPALQLSVGGSAGLKRIRSDSVAMEQGEPKSAWRM